MTLKELCATTELPVEVTGDGTCYDCGDQLSWNEWSIYGVSYGAPTCEHNRCSHAHRGDSVYFGKEDNCTRVKLT